MLLHNNTVIDQEFPPQRERICQADQSRRSSLLISLLTGPYFFLQQALSAPGAEELWANNINEWPEYSQVCQEALPTGKS